MSKWNILSWDDLPKTYLNDLIKRLHDKGSFEVTLSEKIDDCMEIFNKDPDKWDCLILDVIDETSDPEKPDKIAGVNLAARIRQIKPDIPIIFLTEYLNQIFESGIVIEQPFILRPKSYPVPFISIDIVNLLEANKTESDTESDKVFLIYGSNSQAGNIKEEVEDAIKGKRLRCEVLAPEKIMESISEGLVNAMKKCRAIIAICTPDDKIGDVYQPRQNVLLEIGMAMALGNGFKRLIILQRWGKKPEFQAILPSDLGGAFTIRFFDNYKEAIKKMITALKKRGVRSKN